MPELKETWTIPILVRHHGSKIVIYVDKPLPPTSMTTEEKSNLRCKRGARMKMAQPWNRGNIHGKKRTRSPKKKMHNAGKLDVERPNIDAGGDDLFGESMDLSSLETFGLEGSRSPMLQASYKILICFTKIDVSLIGLN
jgi:hypothetical protein